MRDFEVYWTAGGRAAAAGPLYRVDDGHYRFKYLPAFAIAVSPLSRLSLPRAKAVWFAVSVASLIGLVWLSIAAVSDPGMRPAVLAFLTVVAMAKFFAHELVLGQANLLFGAVCMAGVAALLRGRDVRAGLLLGAATLIKPYAIAFVPYLLIVGRPKAALPATLSVGCVVLLPLGVYGVGGTASLLAQWWLTASETSAALLTNADSVSVFAFGAKWLGWGRGAVVLSALMAAGLCSAFVLVLARRRRVGRPELLEVALLLTYIPLLTPQGWDYALLLSTPLVALLLARVNTMPAAERALLLSALGIVAFSLYDVLGREVYGAFMGWSAITVCYVAIIGVATRLRVRARA